MVRSFLTKIATMKVENEFSKIKHSQIPTHLSVTPRFDSSPSGIIILATSFAIFGLLHVGTEFGARFYRKIVCETAEIIPKWLVWRGGNRLRPELRLGPVFCAGKSGDEIWLVLSYIFFRG